MKNKINNLRLREFFAHLEQKPLGSYACSRYRSDNGLVSYKCDSQWKPFVFITDKYVITLCVGDAAPTRSYDNAAYHKWLNSLEATRTKVFIDAGASTALKPRARTVTIKQAKEIMRHYLWQNVVPLVSVGESVPQHKQQEWWDKSWAYTVCSTIAELQNHEARLRSGAMSTAQAARNELNTLTGELSSGTITTVEQLRMHTQKLAEKLYEYHHQCNKLVRDVPDARYGSTPFDERALTAVNSKRFFDPKKGCFNRDKNIDDGFSRSQFGVKVSLPEDLLLLKNMPHLVEIFEDIGQPLPQPFGIKICEDNFNKLAVLKDTAAEMLKSYSLTDQPEPENKNESKPYEITI